MRGSTANRVLLYRERNRAETTPPAENDDTVPGKFDKADKEFYKRFTDNPFAHARDL